MLHQTFPTLIYQASLGTPGKTLRDDIEEESYKFSDIDEAGQKWCEEHHYHGYTSYGSLDKIHEYSTTFEMLEKEIRKHVRKYIKDLEYEISADELAINSMWINIMPEGASHSAHLHPLSVISGTYYVKVPKSASQIKFEDPRLASFMNQPPKKKRARQSSPYHVEIEPKQNDLILFESWLRHEVPLHSTKEHRISVSFNYGWKR